MIPLIQPLPQARNNHLHYSQVVSMNKWVDNNDMLREQFSYKINVSLLVLRLFSVTERTLLTQN